MISILIPVYNFEITNFVNQLVDSAMSAKITFEIIVMDDYSTKEWREKLLLLSSLDNVRVIYLQENVGRSAIRNKLLIEAKFDLLIYLDADGKLISNDFIANYLKYSHCKVVYGGRQYDCNQYSDKEYKLHCRYGTRYESVHVNKRLKNPYLYFHSNNFMVSKSVMEKFQFENKLKEYGYEDILWAITLKQNSIKVYHIENPVLHLGLEIAETFLIKVDSSLKNLASINREKIRIPGSLSSCVKWINIMHLDAVVLPIFRKSESLIRRNLFSNNPYMLALQWYRFGKYLEYCFFLKQYK
ncbi:MAG: glycosyltransferase family 2 protein [Saprospiraceae bacterium]|nr:glycosyltransferase family 2 protein [Saprospiraceae bacterium]